MQLSPLYTAVTIKAEKMRQALNLLRQYERDGYGVIATMTVHLWLTTTFQFKDNDKMINKKAMENHGPKNSCALIPLS